MKILLCKQGEPATVEEISGDLISLQQTVGGLIEAHFITESLALVINEEGRILEGLLPNRVISLLRSPTVIYGDFFFCGAEGDEFCDIDPLTAEVGLKLFNHPDFDKDGKAITDTGRAMEGTLHV